MTQTKLQDELDERFLRRQWIMQRTGWALMLLIMVLAALGIFGTSPLATKTEKLADGDATYEVEHPRFTRYQLLDRLHVRIHAPSTTGDELKLAFSNDWIENNNVRSTTPEADGGGADATGGAYTYRVDDWSRPIAIAVEYETRKAFRSPGTLTITAGAAEPVQLPLDAWVNP